MKTLLKLLYAPLYFLLLSSNVIAATVYRNGTQDFELINSLDSQNIIFSKQFNAIIYLYHK